MEEELREDAVSSCREQEREEKAAEVQHTRLQEQRAGVMEKGVMADGTEAALEPVKSSEPFGEIEIPQGKSYEEMNVEELQKVVYEKMKKNGPVNERMLRDIQENVYHNSLVNWAKSFR